MFQIVNGCTLAGVCSVRGEFQSLEDVPAGILVYFKEYRYRASMADPISDGRRSSRSRFQRKICAAVECVRVSRI